jgi:hypothetical protein
MTVGQVLNEVCRADVDRLRCFLCSNGSKVAISETVKLQDLEFVPGEEDGLDLKSLSRIATDAIGKEQPVVGVRLPGFATIEDLLRRFPSEKPDAVYSQDAFLRDGTRFSPTEVLESLSQEEILIKLIIVLMIFTGQDDPTDTVYRLPSPWRSLSHYIFTEFKAPPLQFGVQKDHSGGPDVKKSLQINDETFPR